MVESDLDDGELVADPYSRFRMSESEGLALRLVLGDEGGGLYLDAGRMEVVTPGLSPTSRMDSIAAGGELTGLAPDAWLGLRGYGALALGLGVARFSSPLRSDTESWPLAELEGSIGVMLERRISLGAGLKWQVIGFPGETVANSLVPRFTLGIRF